MKKSRLFFLQILFFPFLLVTKLVYLILPNSLFIVSALSFFTDKVRIYSKNEFLITYKIFSNSNQINSLNREVHLQTPKTAIILQGPLDDWKFTFNTVCRYKSLFPSAVIILSTWNNVESRIIDNFRKLEVEIILNNPPKFNGNYNINFQIVSTNNAIEMAKKLECSYLLKTRTDTRLSSPSLIFDLFSLLSLHDRELPHKRIIINTQARSMFIPFFPSDFFVYGHVSNLSQLYDVPLQETNFSINNFRSSILKNNFSIKFYVDNNLIPEIYLFYNYAKKLMGDDLLYTVKNYWSFLKKYTIVISFSDVLFYWNKSKFRNDVGQYYGLNRNNKFNQKYHKDYFFTYGLWNSLVQGVISYESHYEEIAEQIGIER